MFHGQPRKLLLQANRNGMFYVLDRTNGKLSQRTPFVRQTWNTGFDENGRPKAGARLGFAARGQHRRVSVAGRRHQFSSALLQSRHRLGLRRDAESGQRFVRSPQEFEPGRQYQGGRGQGLGEPVTASIKAIDPETGATKWEYKISRGSLAAGVLATAGGLVFAATGEGT